MQESYHLSFKPLFLSNVLGPLKAGFAVLAASASASEFPLRKYIWGPIYTKMDTSC